MGNGSHRKIPSLDEVSIGIRARRTLGAGWEIHTSGAGAPDVWYVAIPDMAEAMEAVAHTSRAIIDSRCIRRELSTRDIKNLG
jgi:hypothetical protein